MMYAFSSALALFAAARTHFAQRALEHPDLHIIGNLNHDLAVILYLGHLADQPAGRHDRVAPFNALDQLLVRLDALLLGPDQKEIEDSEQQNQRNHGRNEGVVQIHFSFSWAFENTARNIPANIAPRGPFATGPLGKEPGLGLGNSNAQGFRQNRAIAGAYRGSAGSTPAGARGRPRCSA